MAFNARIIKEMTKIGKNIFIAGGSGMVGSALIRILEKQTGITIHAPDRQTLNLLDQHAVLNYFKNNTFDQVYIAAAKVGGIHANNTYPAEFIYENLVIESNIIHAAHMADINQLLFLGSSCIYPKHADQPIKEEALLTGKLEPTNEPYAIAKITGIKLCESYNRQYGRDYRSVMPTNLYGPGDNFHPENAHVIPALIRRFHLAKENHDKEVVIWGSGNPKREFLHVDDMASACIHVMDLSKEEVENVSLPMNSHINVGTGKDCSISELTEIISNVIGFAGKLSYDISKPDGTPRKLLDVGKINKLGWKHDISLKEGLGNTYNWFLKNIKIPSST